MLAFTKNKKRLSLGVGILIVLTLASCTPQAGQERTTANQANNQVTQKEQNVDGKKYVFKHGIEFAMPEKWIGKVELIEDEKQIIAYYTRVPSHKVERFSVSCMSHSNFQKMVEGDEDYNRNFVIGKNAKYVFYYYAPIDLDMSPEESKQYGDDYLSVSQPYTEDMKLFRVLD